MAVGYLTSNSLIDTIKRIAMIPQTQNTFTEDDFLAFANQELRIGLVPSVLSVHQEYYVRDIPVPMVGGQSTYAIPYRAIGGKFRDIFYKDINGNLRSMTRINLDDRPYYQQTNFQNRFIYFSILGNEVLILPDVGPTAPVGSSLIFSIFFRPNELVDESRVATITDISTGPTGTVFTVDQIPTGFSTSVLLDIMQTRPGHKTINYDVMASAISNTNNTITFATPVSEITSITTVPDVSNSLNGTYFTLNSAFNTTQYYVWYITSGASPIDPGIIGKMGIAVNIPTNATAQDVATFTKNAINDFSQDFTATSAGSNVMVTNIVAGDALDGANGTPSPGFTIVVTQQGFGTPSTQSLDNSIIVGDYISFSGECIIPQVPSDLHDVLAQRVAARCLQALGDQAGYAVANNKLEEMEKKTGNLIDNRSEGSAMKLNNLTGVLRGAKIRKRGWI